LPAANWTQARPSERSTRPFDLGSAAIGAAAIGLAIFIDWICSDRTGAVLVLLMAGAMIAFLGRRAGPGRLAQRPPSN
jgi:hypothetical protein